MEDILRKATVAMRILDHEHRRIITQLVSHYTGTSHSQHLLLMVLSHDTFRSQKEIAARLNISPAAVTMSLKKLEADGYIERNTNPDDTRFNFVTITQKGKDVVSYSESLFQEIDTELYRGMSEEDLTHLIRSLEIILENLRRIEKDPPFEELQK